jgi:S-adenosylmethionine-diacylgycerolhomoserine-N-methlytransferase
LSVTRDLAASLRTATPEQAQQRAFLNRYYGASRFLYDATRKYYLLGRDPALQQLLTEPWESLVEVGAGTGRNLRWLQKRRPEAVYGGVEPCDEMRRHAAARLPWARLVDAFAEQVDYRSILGRPPERILFSYCLSMVSDPALALSRAFEALAPQGQLVVVDFGEFAGLPAVLRVPFRRFLAAFHVEPRDPAALGPPAAEVRDGAFGYYRCARFRAPDPPGPQGVPKLTVKL